jgi:outer membrane protein OmpA-like peptidoglycan-associated protein
MNASKLTYLMAIAVALTFVAGGCKKKPVGVTNLPGYANKNVPDPNAAENSGRLKPVEDPNASPIDRPLNPDFGGNLEEKFNLDRATLQADTVHFDYDSVAIRGNEKPHVEAVASYMKSAPANVAVLVEGHCDERGTEEYNRALGERRALAIREALIASGVDSQKIATRSYGKDRKLDLGPSEAAHARNRRGEFVVLTPK